MLNNCEKLSEKYISQISANIKLLLEMHSMNILELSTKIDISYSAAYSATNGTSNPTLSTLISIASAFNINLSQLIGEFPLSTKGVRPIVSAPMMDWDKILDFLDAPQSVKNNNCVIVSTEATLSDKIFALYPNQKTEPLFKLGTILIFDKLNSEITDYDAKFVLISTNNQTPTMRKLHVEENKIFLQSINHVIPSVELTECDRIIAYLVQARVEFN